MSADAWEALNTPHHQVEARLAEGWEIASAPSYWAVWMRKTIAGPALFDTAARVDSSAVVPCARASAAACGCAGRGR